jgi:hypothetical protein
MPTIRKTRKTAAQVRTELAKVQVNPNLTQDTELIVKSEKYQKALIMLQEGKIVS